MTRTTDACATAKSTLIRDFLDSVRIRHDSELENSNESHNGLGNNIQISDFYEVISRVLKNSGYKDDDIQSVLNEIRHNTLPHLPISLLDDADNAARALGLPSATFARELTIRESSRIRANTRCKEYVLELTPSFYNVLLDQISTLKYDWNDDLYSRLVKQLTTAPVRPNLLNLSRQQRRLNQIRTTVIRNAQKLQANTAFQQSLLDYSKYEIYPERMISARFIECITKPKTKSQSLTAAKDTWTSKFVNCFRCAATTIDNNNSSFKFKKKSDCPQKYQYINVPRLICYQNDDILNHYRNEHLHKDNPLKRGLPVSQPFVNCDYIIPCTLCVSDFLLSDKTEIGYDDHLFACCLGCITDHFRLVHDSHILNHLQKELKKEYPHNTDFKKSCEQYLDIICIACTQLFSSNTEKREHQTKNCFRKFVSLSLSFGQPLCLDFAVTPYMQQIRESRVSSVAINQLVKIRDSLTKTQNNSTHQPQQQQKQQQHQQQHQQQQQQQQPQPQQK